MHWSCRWFYNQKSKKIYTATGARLQVCQNHSKHTSAQTQASEEGLDTKQCWVWSSATNLQLIVCIQGRRENRAIPVKSDILIADLSHCSTQHVKNIPNTPAPTQASEGRLRPCSLQSDYHRSICNQVRAPKVGEKRVIPVKSEMQFANWFFVSFNL